MPPPWMSSVLFLSTGFFNLSAMKLVPRTCPQAHEWPQPVCIHEVALNPWDLVKPGRRNLISNHEATAEIEAKNNIIQLHMQACTNESANNTHRCTKPDKR
jgi:hypothetical protein